MHARLTGTTALAGSMAGCLSERARGSAAASMDVPDSDGGGQGSDGAVGLDSVDDLDSAADRDLVAERESAYVDRLVLDSAADCHAEVAFIPAAASMAAVVHTAEAASTVEAVRMVAATAADTGKIQQ